jgi:small conductance mechanosensitive channel
MPIRLHSMLLLIVTTLFITCLSLSSAIAAESGDSPLPTTTSDPLIPTDELALLLKPLKKEELLVEADGWQSVVKDKAQEIAHTEIAVRRQNKEIDKAEEIKQKANAAKKQLKEVADRVDEVSKTGDAAKLQDVQQALGEAHERIDEVQLSVDETVDAARKATSMQSDIGTEARQSLDETAEAAKKAKRAATDIQKTLDAAESAGKKDIQAIANQAKGEAAEAHQATDKVQEKVDDALGHAMVSTQKAAVLDEAAEAVDQAEEVKKAEKISLLEKVTVLREERTQMLDNMRAVVDELETKTDKEDADTTARIKDYRLYISSVSGIHVDVTDTTSAWLTLKGWITSREGGLRWLINISSFLGILVFAWFLAKILSRLINRAMDRVHLPALLEDFLVKSVRWVVMIIGVIWALSALEVSIAPLLALVGAAGFIIAFAMQDSLSNFASGLMILFFRPFDMGDVVDAGGVSGKVSSMNLVSTSIKTFDNKLMVVPNSKIWSDVITNATGVTQRRVDMEFGIGYGDDFDKAQQILEEIVFAHPKVLKEPEPVIKMSALADSSVNFICRPWTSTDDYWDVYWDITKQVKQRFDDVGIGIPYPQRDVHLYIENSADVDRAAAVARGRARDTRDVDVHGSPTATDGGLDT